MPRVQLKVKAVESDDWLATLSTELPDAEFQILASHPTDGGLLVLVEVTTPDGDTLVRRFDDAPEVRSHEVIHSAEGMVLIQFVVPVPSPHAAVRGSGNLPRYPVRMQDGWSYTELTASQEQLAEFTDELAAADIPYQIQSLIQSHDSIELLTERQQQLITEAVERGYYENPRDCTLTELAASFEINKSAASGILRRAEGQIITGFVADAAT
jgi:predicted DNA binding protein